MRDAIAPRHHLFVCANRREPNSPLGEGCAERGEALYDELKREVSARGLVTRVWITKTHCLGICPREGATVARYATSGAPHASPIVTEAHASDARALLAAVDQASLPPKAPEPAPPLSIDALREEIEAIEELQKQKVLALARRLKPGLTLEDVQNPHDFPELDDPDWHYLDGVLAGVQSVKSTLLAMNSERRKDGEDD